MTIDRHFGADRWSSASLRLRCHRARNSACLKSIREVNESRREIARDAEAGLRAWSDGPCYSRSRMCSTKHFWACAAWLPGMCQCGILLASVPVKETSSSCSERCVSADVDEDSLLVAQIFIGGWDLWGACRVGSAGREHEELARWLLLRLRGCPSRGGRRYGQSGSRPKRLGAEHGGAGHRGAGLAGGAPASHIVALGGGVRRSGGAGWRAARRHL